VYKFTLVDKISLLLVIIGALNGGLIGITNFDLVETIFKLFGSISQILQRIVYILVGVAGVNITYLIYKSKYKNASWNIY